MSLKAVSIITFQILTRQAVCGEAVCPPPSASCVPFPACVPVGVTMMTIKVSTGCKSIDAAVTSIGPEQEEADCNSPSDLSGS